MASRIYYFAVVAVDALGQSNPAVRAASAQASVAGVGEVVNLAGSSSATSITFTWQPPPNSGSFVRGYHIYFGGAATPVVLDASTTSYTATGLQPATGYSFRITTIDPFGSESSGDSIVGATLLPNPGNVSLTARSGQVVLLWDRRPAFGARLRLRGLRERQRLYQYRRGHPGLCRDGDRGDARHLFRGRR